MARDQEVLNALLSKLYMVLNAGDTVANPGGLPSTSGSFVSFTTPGIPLAPEDLSFGFSATLDEVERAAAFAELVNSLPNLTGFWRSSGDKLWTVYRKVLEQAATPGSNLTEKEEKQLQKMTKLLFAEVQDPIDDEKTILIDTPLLERYYKLKAEYEDAQLKYNTLLINVQANKDNPAIVADWNINGPIYRSRVLAARDRWVGGGKDVVEKAFAIISQLSGRDPALVFRQAKDRLDRSVRDSIGGEYYFTKFFPTKFYDASTSWTKFTFKNDEVKSTSTTTATSWGGGAAIGFGLWSFGASAQGSSQEQRSSSDASNLDISVELIRLPLRRSWFTPGLLTSRSWRFPETDEVLSDGAVPPRGLMPAYPTDIIVARNLRLTMDMATVQDQFAASQFSSSASVSWGPFSLRGNYSKNTSSQKHDFAFTAGGIECPGMQIIGFVCQLLPKCPNPDPALDWQDGVEPVAIPVDQPIHIGVDGPKPQPAGGD